MRILLVNKFLYPNGGSETYMFEIGKTLADMGHEVQYFGMEHEKRTVGNHAQAYTENMSFRSGNKLSKLSYPFKIIYSVEARNKIREVLNDFRPDVVHLNNINFQITPSIIDEVKYFSSDIRVVYTAHDAQWVCPNHMMRIPATGELCRKCINGSYWECARNRCIHNSFIQSVLGAIEAEVYKSKRTYEKVDLVISPSVFLKEVLSHNKQLEGKIISLHNPINSQTDKMSEAEKESILRQMNLSDKGYILYFGRFDSEKGIDLLMEACDRLRDIPFVFAGKGERESEIAVHTNIHNMGFRTGKELAALIKGARFSVVPSIWYENCPYSVIESQLMGTPVVASNIGGIPELILTRKNSDTPTGVLYQYNSIDELIDCIGTLWENKESCLQMTSNCNALVKGELSLKFRSAKEYCEELLTLYQDDQGSKLSM